MRILYVIIIVGLASGKLFSQTCCSGGVPITGNIGFSSAVKGTWQFELSYDYNRLTNLYNGKEQLDDNSRIRITNSALLKIGYSISDRFGVDALITYVGQKREISQAVYTSTDKTIGPGDAVIILKYVFLNSEKSGIDLQLGMGPKIPTGSSTITNPSGIVYNADLQPGSGSWDLISWLQITRPLNVRPSVVISGSGTLRINGKNSKYFENQTYRFGNSYQLFAGISDRLPLGNILIEPALSFRFRKAYQDRINGQKIVNTGGEWIYFSPSIGLIPFPNVMLFASGELPVFSRLDGTQLSTAYRIRVGIYYLLNRKNKNNNIKIDEL